MPIILNPTVRVITALDLIQRSMKLINALAVGQTLDDGEDQQDALSTFNELLDNWNTEKISVYGKIPQDFPTQAGVKDYTIGPGGDFDTERPVYIDNAICIRSGVSYPIEIINQREYDRISLKSQPSGFVTRLLYTNSFPLGQVTVWPVPDTADLTLRLAIPRQLSNITTLSQVIYLPPGYLRALRFCLAVELWPEYTNPSTDIGTIKAIANSAKADISRANMVDPIAFFTDVPGVDTDLRPEYWS